MARLWDAIRESTERGGSVISLPPVPSPVATGAAPDLAEAVRP
jgi:hypothetical protein